MAIGKIKDLPKQIETKQDVEKWEEAGWKCKQGFNNSFARKTLNRKLDPLKFRYKYSSVPNAKGSGVWVCAMKLPSKTNEDPASVEPTKENAIKKEVVRKKVTKEEARALLKEAINVYATVAANNKLDVTEEQFDQAAEKIIGWIAKGKNGDEIAFKLHQLVQIQKGDIEFDVNEFKRSHDDDSLNEKLKMADEIDN